MNRVFKLYTDYQDVIDYAKVVTINEIKDKDYTLAVNTDIEKTKAETKDPTQVRAEFFAALEDVKVKEERMKQLLREGGSVRRVCVSVNRQHSRRYTKCILGYSRY